MTEENFQKEREQKEDVVGIFQTKVAEKDRTIRAKRRYQRAVKENRKKEIIKNDDNPIKGMYLPGAWNITGGKIEYDCRYVKYTSNSNAKKKLKKESSRMIRKSNEEFPKGWGCRKIYDYDWKIF